MNEDKKKIKKGNEILDDDDMGKLIVDNSTLKSLDINLNAFNNYEHKKELLDKKK